MNGSHHTEATEANGAPGEERQPGRNRLVRYYQARLHRKIFLWFGATIVVTLVVTAATILMLLGEEGLGWHRQLVGAPDMLRHQLEATWDTPEMRDAFCRALAHDMGFHVRLFDAQGRLLREYGEPNGGPERGQTLTVEREGRILGSIRLDPDLPHHSVRRLLVVLVVFGLTLWLFSGIIALRIARPLADLARVVEDMGRGNLTGPVQVGRGHSREIHTVARAINDMAERIRRQMADQRELLAGVSHEMRTPLGHLRVLVELARENCSDPSLMDEMERELVEADRLVDQLLVSSRLDFDAVEMRPLEANAVARRAAERADLPDDVFFAANDDPQIDADPTLLARALANILANAQTHGRGVRAFRVRATGGTIRFEVEDSGPGFSQDALAHAFERFYRDRQGEKTGTSGSLGLGLSLVQRIAHAHGGRVGAENLPTGGARVWLELPRSSKVPAESREVDPGNPLPDNGA